MRRRELFRGGSRAARRRRARGTAAARLRLRVPDAGRGAGGRFRSSRFAPPRHRDEGLRRVADAHLRPAVRLRQTGDQPGLVGWGEGTLEGKAGAAMACVEDFRDFVMGSDPMQVEHTWQSMYVHSFYRAGPVIGLGDLGHRPGAVGHPRQSPGHAGVPAPGRTARSARRAGLLSRRWRAHAARRWLRLRQTAIQQGVSCFKTGLPDYYEWIETREKIQAAVKSMQVLREALGPEIDIAVDFHAKTSPSVASILVKEVEPLNLLFIEEPCPPENVQAMAKIARRSTTPIATGERLVATYGCRELIEMGVIDILQTDINHVGGVTGLWKVAQMAAVVRDFDGAARVRRTDRRPGDAPRECGHAQLRGAGDLRPDPAGRGGQGVGGVARLPRHAHGGRPVPVSRKARPGLRV